MQNLKLDHQEMNQAINFLEKIIECLHEDIEHIKSNNMFEKIMAYTRTKVLDKTIGLVFEINKLGIRTGLSFQEIQKQQTCEKMEKWIQTGASNHPIFIQEECFHSKEKEIVVENELELAEALQKIYREISSHMEQKRKENETPEVTH